MNFKAAIPIIHVNDMANALNYYCNQLGFQKQWDYFQEEGELRYDYVSIQREGICIHLSSFPGDSTVGAAISFIVESVDKLFGEFKEKALAIELEPFNQSWGNREMYLRDPDGNHLRFIQYPQTTG